MIKFITIAVPAALALAAFGVQAQTIETDYPFVGSKLAPTVASAPFGQTVPSKSALSLVQSNFEGPKVDPAPAAQSTLTRQEVRADARVKEPYGPGHNA